jgi:O-antigen/teichoic acid export membrane protein
MYFAIGQPNIHRTASMVRTCIFLILIYPATKIFGLTGAASAALIAILVLMLIQLIYAHKAINLSISEYLCNWLPGIKTSLLIIIPGIILHIFFEYRGIGFLLIGFTLCLVAWGYGVIKTGLFCHGPVSQLG